MAEVKESSILIQDVETKNIMTKSALPAVSYTHLDVYKRQIISMLPAVRLIS